MQGVPSRSTCPRLATLFRMLQTRSAGQGAPLPREYRQTGRSRSYPCRSEIGSKSSAVNKPVQATTALPAGKRRRSPRDPRSIASAEPCRLALDANLTETQVKTWFQYRRSSGKRKQKMKRVQPQCATRKKRTFLTRSARREHFLPERMCRVDC